MSSAYYRVEIGEETDYVWAPSPRSAVRRAAVAAADDADYPAETVYITARVREVIPCEKRGQRQRIVHDYGVIEVRIDPDIPRCSNTSGHRWAPHLPAYSRGEEVRGTDRCKHCGVFLSWRRSLGQFFYYR